MDILNGKKLILASKSPRRAYLLEKADLKFEVRQQDVEETFPNDLPLREVAEYLAIKKSDGCLELLGEGEIMLSADSIVIMGNRIFGKPEDTQDAFEIIKSIQGKVHEVITGVCIRDKKKKISFSDTTRVSIDPMTDKEITHYVNNYEVLDKAGAYAIQDWIGIAKIGKIEGSYSNVMGLPMSGVYEALQSF